MRIRLFIALTLLGGMIFLAFNRHSKDKFNNYHSVLWADAAGYYVYLPLAFTSFFAETRTEEIEKTIEETGEGFRVEEGIVKTKYTYGTAFLQAPFYLAIQLFSKNQYPFSKGFHQAIILAGAIYAWLGLLFLFLALRVSFSEGTSLFVSLTILFATNLFYYAIDAGGMSHVYSFFAFSGLAGTLSRMNRSRGFFLCMLFFIAVAVTIRPINLLGALFTTTIMLSLKPGLTETLRFHLGSVLSWLWMMIVFFIAVLPQVVYWRYAFDSFFTYSYQGEGFSNWTNPYVMEVLFSSNNGLLPYNPFWLVLIFSCLYLLCSASFQSRIIGVWSLTLFLLVTYLFSSWWSWHFGCGFGHRAYVEYLVPFSIPFAMFVEKVKDQKTSKYILWGIALLFVAWNLKLTYTFDECWYYGTWDYAAFAEEMLFGKTR